MNTAITIVPHIYIDIKYSINLSSVYYFILQSKPRNFMLTTRRVLQNVSTGVGELVIVAGI